jgi:hypothetical protein
VFYQEFGIVILELFLKRREFIREIYCGFLAWLIEDFRDFLEIVQPLGMTAIAQSIQYYSELFYR